MVSPPGMGLSKVLQFIQAVFQVNKNLAKILIIIISKQTVGKCLRVAANMKQLQVGSSLDYDTLSPPSLPPILRYISTLTETEAVLASRTCEFCPQFWYRRFSQTGMAGGPWEE